jgi:hypothetical protein
LSLFFKSVYGLKKRGEGRRRQEKGRRRQRKAGKGRERQGKAGEGRERQRKAGKSLRAQTPDEAMLQSHPWRNSEEEAEETHS